MISVYIIYSREGLIVIDFTISIDIVELLILTFETIDDVTNLDT